jgi:3-methyladenine DNA glycosylase AlkD
MNTVDEVMDELKKFGDENTLKMYARYKIPGERFGVKVSDMKTIVKQIKGKQALALELYETGNYDAMYLAGLVADGALMTKKQIESWAKNATCGLLSQYTVAWVAAESSHARSLALKWMKSKQEKIACSGWNTYTGMCATRPDDELDLDEIKDLLNQVVDTIDAAQGEVRYTMNGFVIAVGSYVKPLLKAAKSAAKKIGVVEVDMGDTACKVPNAVEYIAKIETKGRVGKKRKATKC